MYAGVLKRDSGKRETTTRKDASHGIMFFFCLCTIRSFIFGVRFFFFEFCVVILIRFLLKTYHLVFVNVNAQLYVDWCLMRWCEACWMFRRNEAIVKGNAWPRHQPNVKRDAAKYTKLF